MTTTAELRSKRDQKEQEITDIAHRIEDRIDFYKEQEITDIAHRIEDRIDFYKDWQKMVRDYPLQSMGIALGTGFLVSGVGGGLLRFGLRQVEALFRAGLMAYILAWLSTDTHEKRKAAINTQHS